jgi:hypothetical protein
LDEPTRNFGVLPTPAEWSSGTEQDGPVDLSALRADDELLTALCSFDNSAGTSDQDPELKSLLLSWRLAVDAEPIGELVDTDTAMTTIAVGARLHKRRPRYLVPLATAAAALVVLFGGMGLAARSAVPGDALWSISQVLYSDHAHSVEAAALVRTDLNHASEAMQQGHFLEARNALVQAQASLPAVDSEDGKANLQAQQQNLLDLLDNTTALTTSPTTPVGTDPVATTPTSPPPDSSVDPSQAAVPPPTTTTTQPPSSEPTTTDAPPTSTTDSPSPQTSTVGDAPAQPAQPPAGNAPQDQPAQQFDASVSGSSTAGGS